MRTTAVGLLSTVVGGDPGDLWSWFYTQVSVQGVLNITGLTLLVILFSRDMILTKGQHERRVADLTKAKDDRYADMVREKDSRIEDILRNTGERYTDMRDSRDAYRDTADELENRNRTLTDAVVESNRSLGVAATALQSLDAVAHEGRDGGRPR